ncbi:FAD-dependent oxidoreductase, partial [Thermodesulfobacteriota bacterium]
MGSIYFKKCYVCSVEDKEKDSRCKKCSGKLSDIQRILVEAKESREEVVRSKNSFLLALLAPIVGLLAILIIINPILFLVNKMWDSVSPFSGISAVTLATIFVCTGHVYSKRYVAALCFAFPISLSLVLLDKTYLQTGMTLSEVLLNNGLNFGVIAMFFIFLEIWLLVANDARKGSFKLKKAPCQVSCPAGIDIPHYVSLISDDKYEEALNLIRENNALPAVIGRICPHPCEQSCIRTIDGEPIAINPLKRFVSDFERDIKKRPPTFEVLKKQEEKVAIIGSGPAGLSAAYFLARLGVMSTIYEQNSVAGGMLALSIPKYRLPRDILNYEIDIIKKLGVTIETNSKIGTDSISIKSLLEKGFNAVLIAVGTQSGIKLRIAGEDSKGVSDCLSFLKEASEKEKKVIGGKAVVVGGGNAAIDTARTLLRLGSEKVTVLYRRSSKEMPANPAEVKAAEEEGISFEFLSAPKSIISENGIARGIECIRMRLGEPDASGRRRPVPIDGSEFTIEADTIISAIGQALSPNFVTSDEKLEFTKRHLIKVDNDTLKTSMANVYSAGDCISGPSTAISALAKGKKAALSIFYDLCKDKIEWPDYKDKYIKKCEIIENERAIKKLRIRMPHLALKERTCTFSEVEKGYS